MTPVTRQTPVPLPQQQRQAAPSPRSISQKLLPQQPSHTPVAPPSPAPTPKQESPVAVPETTPPPQPPARRQSAATHPLSLPPEHKIPFYPTLPWYSEPDAPFPPRASARRRKRLDLHTIDSVALPSREATMDERQDQIPDDQKSESSAIAAPSEQETPATSQAPSESDFTQASAPPTPAQVTEIAAKIAPVSPQHARRDTRTAIAVPNIPGFGKPKPSPPAGDTRTSSQGKSEDAISTPEVSKTITSDGEQASSDNAAPISPPPKPAPQILGGAGATQCATNTFQRSGQWRACHQRRLSAEERIFG